MHASPNFKWRRSGLIALLAALTIFSAGCSNRDRAKWKPQASVLKTRWTDKVKPGSVHASYPRPQMVREIWGNLNGIWEFSVQAKDAPAPETYDKHILVPFPVESALSGVMERIDETRCMWYRREFDVPPKYRGGKLLLHFGAVDWEARVYVNGKRAGIHYGGYDSFTIDITDHLMDGSKQELILRVWDPSDRGTQPAGKQRLNPRGIWYTPTSGIWRTVWLEPLPETYIQNFRLIPDLDRGSLWVEVTSNTGERIPVTLLARAKRRAAGEASGRCGERIELKLDSLIPWTPDSPFLYDLEILLGDKNSHTDRVESYFAMRNISIGQDEKGITRILLNEKFVFQLGPLDQGFWPDGLYTAPSDDALRFDVEFMKKMGFNMVRKHVKVEPDRWYYWCDRLGLMVWQDMPSGKNVTDQDKMQFEFELKHIIQNLFNHPSIIMWVPFNEGWGQYDAPRIAAWIKNMDPTRLVNHASGWTDNGAGDVSDIHSYPDPRSPDPESVRAAVLGEFGGLGFNVKGHAWNPEGWGYDLLQDFEGLAVRYESLYRQLLPFIERPGLSAAVYTQISDIESENNGLMTYDRKILKIDPEVASRIHKGYFSPQLASKTGLFIDSLEVRFLPQEGEPEIRYTLDGKIPDARSSLYKKPFHVRESTTLKARAFWKKEKSSVSEMKLEKVKPVQAVSAGAVKSGLSVILYEGSWDRLPSFDSLSAGRRWIKESIGLEGIRWEQNFGLRFSGYFKAPQTGVYTFNLISDDGSLLKIGDKEIVNDGIHGAREKRGSLALEAGFHPVRLDYFQKTGGRALVLEAEMPGTEKQAVPEKCFFH